MSSRTATLLIFSCIRDSVNWDPESFPLVTSGQPGSVSSVLIRHVWTSLMFAAEIVCGLQPAAPPSSLMLLIPLLPPAGAHPAVFRNYFLLPLRPHLETEAAAEQEDQTDGGSFWN